MASMIPFLKTLKETIERVETSSNEAKQIVDDEFKFEKVHVFTQKELDKVKAVECDIIKVAQQTKNVQAAVHSQSFSLTHHLEKIRKIRNKIVQFEKDHQLTEKHAYQTWVKPKPVATQEKSEQQINSELSEEPSPELAELEDDEKSPQAPVKPSKPVDSPGLGETPCPPVQKSNLTKYQVPVNEPLNETTCFSQPINIALFDNTQGRFQLDSPNMTYTRDMSSIKEVTVEFTPGLTTKRPAQARNDKVKASLFSMDIENEPSRNGIWNRNPASSIMSCQWLNEKAKPQLAAQDAPMKPSHFASFKAPPLVDETPQRPVSNLDLEKSCKKILQNTKYAPLETPEPPKSIIDPKRYGAILYGVNRDLP